LRVRALAFALLGAGCSGFSRLLAAAALSLIRLRVNPSNGLDLLGADLDPKGSLVEAARARKPGLIAWCRRMEVWDRHLQPGCVALLWALRARSVFRSGSWLDLTTCVWPW
jgi:hypothetical protein